MTSTAAPTQTLARPCNYWTVVLFALVTLGALVGLPTYAYFFDYSWVDWAMFGLLYTLSAMGITVGYHRLISHRSAV
jgi:stearoyl-CoA desaturase (delta-9 desaturase)